MLKFKSQAERVAYDLDKAGAAMIKGMLGSSPIGDEIFGPFGGLKPEDQASLNPMLSVNPYPQFVDGKWRYVMDNGVYHDEAVMQVMVLQAMYRLTEGVSLKDSIRQLGNALESGT